MSETDTTTTEEAQHSIRDKPRRYPVRTIDTTEPIQPSQQDLEDDLYGDDLEGDRPTCIITTVNGEKRKIMQGDRVQPTDILPSNWRAVIHDDGSYTAWEKGNPYHDPEAIERCLKSLDRITADNWPTKANPNRPIPVRLEVNQAWRKLFKHQQTWGKSPTVAIMETPRLDGTKWPAFELIVQQHVEKRPSGKPFGTGAIRVHKRFGAQEYKVKE